MRRLAPLLALAFCAAPAHAADPVLVAVGDIACDPGSSDFNGGDGTFPPDATPGVCHQMYTSDVALGQAPTHALVLGDLQYENATLTKFNGSYDPSWGRMKSITKPVPGNHEYGVSGSPNPNATGYFDYFADELAAEGPDAEDPQKGWYSFDVPVGGTKWHVVAINSECAATLRGDVGWEGGCAPGSAQERWLRADLAADRSDCTLAFWHHPRFNSSPRGDNALIAPIWNALYEDYADIVLAGHEHSYERLAPADSGGARAPGRGIRSWVVGTGGKSLEDFRPTPHQLTDVRNRSAYGVLKLTLHGPSPVHPRGWYEWRFLNDGMSGSTFTDAGSGDCVGPPRPRPAVTPAADTLAPLLSRPRLTRRRFRAGGRGTVIGLTLSEAATATFRVDRRRRGRHRRAGTFRRKLGKGRKRVRFRGRIGRKRLRPGLYRLTITLTDPAGNKSKPRRLFFRVVK